MRTFNALEDDDGVRWEFHYDEQHFVPVLDAAGDPVLDADGRPRMTSRVTELTFERAGSGMRQTLPPWTDIKEEWKTYLCFFDEDEETGELTFWEVSSAREAVSQA